MQDRFNSFVTQYNGQTGVGDTPENIGQCVGLIEVWTDSLGLPHTWGNAKDLLADADPTYFDVVMNTPEGVPPVGAILVLSGKFNPNPDSSDGPGHTGIVSNKADVNTVEIFEQNDHDSNDPNGACQLKTYNYDFVLGWFIPKINPNNQETIDNLKTARDLNKQLYESEVEKNTNLTSQLVDITKKVGDLTSENNGLKTQIQQVNESNASYLGQLQALEARDATAIDSGIKAESDLKDSQKLIQSHYALVNAKDEQSFVSAINSLKKPVDAQVKPLQDHALMLQSAVEANTYQRPPKQQQSFLSKISNALLWFFTR